MNSVSKKERFKLDSLIKFARRNKEGLQCRKQFHVAAIYEGKTRLSIACNSNKTHPKKSDFYPDIKETIHAELMAIILSGRIEFTKCTIYIVRIDNNGRVANSKPCEYCAALIKSFRFKKVIYTQNEICD